MTNPTSKQLEKLEKAMRLLKFLVVFEVLVTLQVCSGQGWNSSCPTCPITPEFKVPEPYVQRKPGFSFLCLFLLPSCLIDWIYYAASADDRRRRLEEWEALKKKLGDARKREASLKDHVASILVSKLRRQGN